MVVVSVAGDGRWIEEEDVVAGGDTCAPVLVVLDPDLPTGP